MERASDDLESRFWKTLTSYLNGRRIAGLDGRSEHAGADVGRFEESIPVVVRYYPTPWGKFTRQTLQIMLRCGRLESVVWIQSRRQ
jgi:hypothetical protein